MTCSHLHAILAKLRSCVVMIGLRWFDLLLIYCTELFVEQICGKSNQCSFNVGVCVTGRTVWWSKCTCGTKTVEPGTTLLTRCTLASRLQQLRQRPSHTGHLSSSVHVPGQRTSSLHPLGMRRQFNLINIYTHYYIFLIVDIVLFL